MNQGELLAFMRAQKWAVEASVSDGGMPQAAVIGVAVTDAFELVFDTLSETRKAQNLRKNPNIALVLGWDDAQTLQYEGVEKMIFTAACILVSFLWFVFLAVAGRMLKKIKPGIIPVLNKVSALFIWGSAVYMAVLFLG